MDTLLAFALLLSVAMLLLYLAWFWLLALLHWGIPTYVGILIGWYVASTSESALFGFGVAALCTGTLGAAVSRGLRNIRSAG